MPHATSIRCVGLDVWISSFVKRPHSVVPFSFKFGWNIDELCSSNRCRSCSAIFRRSIQQYHFCFGFRGSLKIAFLVPRLNFGDSRRLMQYFLWGFRQTSLIQFGPVQEPTKHVNRCRTVLVESIPTATLYFGSGKKSTSVRRVSNCPSFFKGSIFIHFPFWSTIFALVSTPCSTCVFELR